MYAALLTRCSPPLRDLRDLLTDSIFIAFDEPRTDIISVPRLRRMVYHRSPVFGSLRFFSLPSPITLDELLTRRSPLRAARLGFAMFKPAIFIPAI